MEFQVDITWIINKMYEVEILTCHPSNNDLSDVARGTQCP